MLLTSIIICFFIKGYIVYADPKDGNIEPQFSDDQHMYETEGSTPQPGQPTPDVPLNWTVDMSKVMTCEEFLVNSTFDPFKVIDIDWKIWYIWNPQYEEPFGVKFSLASKSLIDRFRTELQKEYKSKVIWDDAILFMETSVDFSALFIKTEIDGIFGVLPSLAFEYHNMPVLPFALKVIEKHGYLAIVNCNFRLAYALAPEDKMPKYETCNEESKKIGFRSIYGRSDHDVQIPNKSYYSVHPAFQDDDEENMEMEYLNQVNSGMESKLM